MDRFLTYLGGIIGGYALIQTEVSGTVLSSLEPIFDTVGAISMIIFAIAFIVRGVRSPIGK